MTPAVPRIAGDREQDILTAALEVLVVSGYDRLTMDAVAARARTSKASLYRHYESKPALVVRALESALPTAGSVDSGGLRGDLVQTYTPVPGRRVDELAVLSSVVSAVARDPELATAFARRFVEPRLRAATDIYRRAQARDEVRADLDPQLLAPVLASLLLLHQLVHAQPPGTADVERLVDAFIVPLVTG